MASFIAIAGNIGTGKTTLTRMLGESLGYRVFFESVSDNPYLSDFYANMHRWSFPIQIFFLTKRFDVHREIRSSTQDSIQDRSIYEDAHIFARGLKDGGEMMARDFETYLALYKQMIQFLDPPDLLVYLRKSVPVLVQNIQKRGRSYEMNIPVEYLERLNKYYDDWILKEYRGKVITIESDDLDFVAREDDFQHIADRIQASLPQPELMERPRRKVRKAAKEWLEFQQTLL